jgi:predicted SpoU family rRNA methylase
MSGALCVCVHVHMSSSSEAFPINDDVDHDTMYGMQVVPVRQQLVRKKELIVIMNMLQVKTHLNLPSGLIQYIDYFGSL